MYIYIYIYTPAPFRGPPGCEGYVCSCCLRVLSVLQSATVSLPVCQSGICFLLSESLPTVLKANCLVDLGTVPLPLSWACSLNPGPPRVSLKNHQISSLLQRPSETRKSHPRDLKSHLK